MFVDLVGETWAWILSLVVRGASVARVDEGNIIKMLVGDLYLSWGVLFAFSLFRLYLHSLGPREKLGCTRIMRCTCPGLPVHFSTSSMIVGDLYCK